MCTGSVEDSNRGLGCIELYPDVKCIWASLSTAQPTGFWQKVVASPWMASTPLGLMQLLIDACVASAAGLFYQVPFVQVLLVQPVAEVIIWQLLICACMGSS